MLFLVPLCLLSYPCHLFLLSPHSFLHNLSCMLFSHAFSCTHTHFSHACYLALSWPHLRVFTHFLECSPLLQPCSFPCPYPFFFFAPSFSCFLMLSLSLPCTCCFSRACSQSHTLKCSHRITPFLAPLCSPFLIEAFSLIPFLPFAFSQALPSHCSYLTLFLSLLFSPLLFLSSSSSSPSHRIMDGLGWK